jgi:hypothetical protein
MFLKATVIYRGKGSLAGEPRFPFGNLTRDDGMKPTSVSTED